MPIEALSSHPAPRVAIIGSFGATNVGDELILAGFLKRLQKDLPRSRVTVLSAASRATKRLHPSVTAVSMLPSGFRSIARALISGSWRQTVDAIRAADAVVFPGGGLFCDEESRRAVWVWGLHILVARYYARPVYLLGQSVGPFRTWFGRWFARVTLTGAESIGVRDAASADELRRLGISPQKITVSHDSALWLMRPGRRMHAPKKPKKILLAVRAYPRLPRTFWGDLIRMLDMLTERYGADIYFVPWETAVHDDRLVWHELKSHSWHGRRWHGAAMPARMSDVISFVGSHDLVIGMRLHSLIAAHIAGVPSIGIAYSRKVAEFQKSVGQVCLDPLDIGDKEKMKDAFDAMCERGG